MIKRTYPVGLDCVWLAVDGHDQLAAFITAGEGPIPEEILCYPNIGVEDVEATLLTLPKVGAAELRVTVPRPDDFLELAERGLFVYDWTDVHRKNHDRIRSYELVALPRSTCLKLAQLSPDLKGLASCGRIQPQHFGDHRISISGPSARPGRD